MTVSTITSASAGTKLATGADTKIVSMTLATPASMSDDRTPLLLVDAAAASAGYARTLYSADLRTLSSFVYGYRPGVALTPGTTAPIWPTTLIGGTNSATFANGVFVQSCPTGTSFSLTTG